MSIDTYAAGAVLIGASTVAAVAGLILLRRFGYFRRLAISHEASGQYLSLVGTLYAVLLGLIVVDAMGRFQNASALVGDETNALAELIYLAGGMPGPQKAEVHSRAADYAHLVIDEEWPVMAQGRHLPAARRSCLGLMHAVRDWEPSSESEKTVYAEAIEAASRFWNARRLRILACQRGIPPLEWCAVILGGMVTVGLTYFLVLEDVRIQVALTAMVAVLIALNIFLILMFAYPFSGDLRVSPDGFHVALAGLTIDARPPATHRSIGESAATTLHRARPVRVSWSSDRHFHHSVPSPSGRSAPMVDLIKKAFYTGLGLAVLTKEKAEELVKDIAQQAKLSEHEGKELVDSLMKQSDQARTDFQGKVDEAVLAVVNRLHLATRDEVQALRAKVDELSAKVGQGGGA